MIACVALAAAGLSTSGPLRAASFDCAKASAASERLICGDPELSTLDEELARGYRNALSREAEGGDSLKSEQRRWLQDVRGQTDVASLKTMYRQRIEDLASRPVFPAMSAAFNGTSYEITEASRQFDFTLRALGPCKPGESCEVPAQLLIRRKGDPAVIQSLNFPTVEVLEPAPGKLLQNSANRYDYQGTINVGDFNFDGHDDFGIQTGNSGSYGGPSYDVYLFDPKKQKFVADEAMTELIAETLGFFEVDQKKKLIRTYAKSGCCDHTTTTYKVNAAGIMTMIAEHNEAVVFEDGEPGKLSITDTRWVGGKPVSTTHLEPLPKGY